MLTKKIKELIAQRFKEPSRGEKWCVNCKMRNHSTEESKQCDFCAVRGHLWENYSVRLKLMLREGQEIRMVTRTAEKNEQSSGTYGGREIGHDSWRGGRAG